MTMYVEYVCLSHAGRVRTENQDNFLCNNNYRNAPFPDGYRETGRTDTMDCPLFAVFDGLGGEEKGEVASLIAAQTAKKIIPGKEPRKALRNFVEDANARICDYARENGVRSMGTTAALLAFERQKVTICNLGDSPVFLFREGSLKKMSVDDLFFSELYRKPPLSQCLGIPPEEMLLVPHFRQEKLRQSDRWLVCSDGLTDMLTEQEIAEIMRLESTQECGDRLLSQALERGGKDNTTIIICSIV